MSKRCRILEFPIRLTRPVALTSVAGAGKNSRGDKPVSDVRSNCGVHAVIRGLFRSSGSMGYSLIECSDGMPYRDLSRSYESVQVEEAADLPSGSAIFSYSPATEILKEFLNFSVRRAGRSCRAEAPDEFGTTQDVAWERLPGGLLAQKLTSRRTDSPATRPRLRHARRSGQGEGRLSGLSHPLEGRRSRHPHLQASQS